MTIVASEMIVITIAREELRVMRIWGSIIQVDIEVVIDVVVVVIVVLIVPVACLDLHQHHLLVEVSVCLICNVCTQGTCEQSSRVGEQSSLILFLVLSLHVS